LKQWNDATAQNHLPQEFVLVPTAGASANLNYTATIGGAEFIG
jgi:hypothetical protein